MTNSDPFFLRGGAQGVLLVHGFAGTPGELRQLGEQLAGHGHTVLAVRLAGHGGQPEELARRHWREWYQSAADGLAALQQSCQRVSLVGFSLGGALAIMLSASNPAISRLALVAAPIQWRPRWLRPALLLGQHVRPWWYPMEQASFDDPVVRRRVLEHAPETDLADPAVQEQIRRSVRISTSAIYQFLSAVDAAHQVAPQVRTPALVIHGRRDQVVAPENAGLLMQRLGSPHKDQYWVDDEGHELLFGPPGRDIGMRIAQFLQ